MPVKNAGAWLEKTIQSILDQQVDWELIAIDDHSVDETWQILQGFQNTDSRIQCHRNNGVGIIPALQMALNFSNGKYITRMDGDDVMPRDRLLHFLKTYSEGSGKQIITGFVKYISDGQVSDGYVKYENWLNNRVSNDDHYNHIYRECVVASPNWLGLRSDFIQDQIFNHLFYPEDYQMTFLWKKLGYKIKGVKEITLHWNEHPCRTSRNSDVYQQNSFFNLKLKHFIENEYSKNQPIAIIGWGKKGKIVADHFMNHGVQYNIYDIDFTKFKGNKIEYRILDPEYITEQKALICVYPDDLLAIENHLASFNFFIGINAWYV